jgi:DNA-binding CsgD family transcriptional regulator/tetratricopeptide (TPR) repeat protein
MQLLERASFLRTLSEYASEARKGDGRLVLVSGESGMGKTALLEAFQQQERGARWLWGACDGLLTPRPLGPLFDIGTQLDGELAAACRNGAPRDRLFASFLAEIGSPANFTVAVIEDVHWADEATTDLLSFAGRRLGRMAALVLVTYRDDELRDDHPLRLVLGDLATQRATRRMRMPPLSVAAVRILAGRRNVDAAELHAVTGGNPFYVSEVLDAGWPSVPPTVRDVVGARLARASAATRRAVESAAIIGTRVDGALLQPILAECGSSMEDCLMSGVLVPDGAGLRFRHELVRMAVAAGIAPHRQAELHARLLALLEARGDADPALLAHHAEGACDARAVLRHAPEAARRSSALGAHHQAAAQFERALRSADSSDPQTLAPLYEGVAAEYALLDRWPETESALRTALEYRRARGDTVDAGRDLYVLSTALWRLCRGHEAELAAREAVTVLEEAPPGPELAWAYAKLGVAILVSGRRDEGVELITRARDLGVQLDQPDVVSFALNAIGLTLVEEGQDGLPTIKQALKIALDADIHEAAGRAYSSLQEGGICLHRFDEAERYYAEGMAYCEERELGVFSTCLTGGRASALLLTGRWDEAAEISAAMLRRPGISPVNRMNPLTVIGSIRGRRREPDAWDLLDEAIALTEGTGEPCWIVPVRAVRAELRYLAGEPGLAAQEIRAARVYLGLVDPWLDWSIGIWLARMQQPPGIEAPAPEPYALELAGDWKAASAHWEQLGRPYDAALVRMGSAGEAGLRDALLTLGALGARATEALVRTRLKALGVKAVPRGPRPSTRNAPAGLTAREQEVLALLCEGLPDRDISRRLFISERTVHHHVSAVLSKIGVASRMAAAREAARMGIGNAL